MKILSASFYKLFSFVVVCCFMYWGGKRGSSTVYREFNMLYSSIVYGENRSQIYDTVSAVNAMSAVSIVSHSARDEPRSLPTPSSGFSQPKVYTPFLGVLLDLV